MAEPVRVVLLEMPTLLRELFEHAITAHGGCALVADGSNHSAQTGSRHQLPPDAIILGLARPEDDQLLPALFARWPDARVMTVMASGGGTVVYELKPRQRQLGEMSPAEIVKTLHEATRRDRDLLAE